MPPQHDWIDLDATTDTGVSLVAALNPAMDALYTMHAGPTAPPGPLAGQPWLDTSVAGTFALKVFDGSTWRVLWTLNTGTGAVGIPGAGYVAKAGDTMTGALDIAANTTGPALAVRQTGTGVALLVEDNVSPDVSPFIIETTGKVFQGQTASDTIVSASAPFVPNVQLSSTAAGAAVAVMRHSADAGPAFFALCKSRGSVGAKAPVANADVIGIILFDAVDDASAWDNPCAIRGYVVGTPAGGAMPGAIGIMAADAAGTLAERVTVTALGTSFIADSVRVATPKTPASATAAGTVGQICWDSGFLYVAVANNVWKRVALATW